VLNMLDKKYRPSNSERLAPVDDTSEPRTVFVNVVFLLKLDKTISLWFLPILCIARSLLSCGVRLSVTLPLVYCIETAKL